MITKREFSFIGLVIICIMSATLINLSASYRKSRDNERKNALGDIVRRVGDFQKTLATFPLSDDNYAIVGCNGFRDELGRWFFKSCTWGENSVNSPFFDPLPQDPYSNEKGRRFVYISNGKTFQIYTALERTNDEEYDPQIVARNISCGDVVCNAGRTNGDISILYSELPPATP